MEQHNSEGFTLIELLVFVLVLTIIAFLALSNIRRLNAIHRDDTNKSHINAIYYQLEAFHEKNGYYPEKLTTTTLKGLDPASLKDTSNVAISDAGSSYKYNPRDCAENKCKSYELETSLENEAPFIKQSLTQ